MLTDILSCPRCGPDFGLILLGDRIEERRVLEGRLGCANCREQYEIRAGFADLTAQAGGSGAPGSAGPGVSDPDEVMRVAAMLGVAEGPGFVLLVGPMAWSARSLADLVEGLEVVAAGIGLESEEERMGVNRIAVGGRLPFYDRSLRAVALSGAAATEREAEGARVVKPGGRLVLEPAAAGAAERLEGAGFHIVVREGDTLVAERG